MNQEDRHYSYSEGDSSTRFYERDNIIEVGTTLARRLLGEDIVVRVGSFASAQPERTVYAPEGLWEELKPLEREWFKVWYAHDDPWYTHEHILEPIAEAWRKVNEKHGVK
jgi:hypothetical protein